MLIFPTVMCDVEVGLSVLKQHKNSSSICKGSHRWAEFWPNGSYELLVDRKWHYRTVLLAYIWVHVSYLHCALEVAKRPLQTPNSHHNLGRSNKTPQELTVILKPTGIRSPSQVQSDWGLWDWSAQSNSELLDWCRFYWTSWAEVTPANCKWELFFSNF